MMGWKGERIQIFYEGSVFVADNYVSISVCDAQHFAKTTLIFEFVE
jgi:hypothetical protein